MHIRHVDPLGASITIVAYGDSLVYANYLFYKSCTSLSINDVNLALYLKNLSAYGDSSFNYTLNGSTSASINALLSTVDRSKL